MIAIMWYTAVIVMRSQVGNGPSNPGLPLLDLQYHLISADSHEDAYLAATDLGRNAAHAYGNAAGEQVSWHFDGLHDLDELLDDVPKHGTEVFSRRVRGRSEQFVAMKHQLSCFFHEAHRDVLAETILAEGSSPDDASIPSIHDSLLTGYEVNGEARTIVLHTKPWSGGGEAFVDVLFEGVVAYQFQSDQFYNIVFGVEETAIEALAEDLATEFPSSGVPPGWNPNAETLLEYFKRSAIEAYRLDSSLGMHGWIAASTMSMIVNPSPPRISLKDAGE